MSDVEGIVLIDEIDKHLHIKMQKEILPQLVNLFPKIQFIITTHSAFVNIGLFHLFDSRFKVVDMEKNGLACEIYSNEIFEEAYEVMIQERVRYIEEYKRLKELVDEYAKPLVITEGETDWKYLAAAKDALKIADLDIELFKTQEPLGDKSLLRMIKEFARFTHGKKVIGVFDRDNFDELKEGQLKKEKYVDYGNGVFAFAIPVVNADEYGTNEISIEHYFLKKDLLKKDSNQRRLFLGEEFYETGISKDLKYHCRDSIQKKVKVNGVIDKKVYSITEDAAGNASIALSKNDFANLILERGEFRNNIDFTQFEKIFDIIREICSIE